MKKSILIYTLVVAIFWIFGCQNKKETSMVERQFETISEFEKIKSIAEKVKMLAVECAETFSTLKEGPYMNYYLDSNTFTFIMNGETVRSYASFYERVKSSMKNLQEAKVEFTDLLVDVYSQELAIVHGPFKWSAVYQDGHHEDEMGHMSFVFILLKGEWKIAFAAEYFPGGEEAP